MRTRRENIETTVRKRKPRHVKIPKEPVVLGNRGKFPCQHCGRVFSTEKIVLTHLCEQRRRFQQKDVPFARLGFEAFNEINMLMFGKDGLKSEEEFRKSEFYLACLRWGHFVIDINCVNIREYLRWLLKMSIPIDMWDKDKIYDSWLQNWVLIEDPWEAFERSVKKITEWGDSESKEYKNYFRQAGTARILTDIRNSSISGWLVFSCESGVSWLGSLGNGDLDLIWGWVDAQKWKILFNKKANIFEQFSAMCITIGL